MNKYLSYVLLLTFNLTANAALFEQGNPKIGKAMHETSCVSCHSSMFGGDGSEMYTREFHKVTDSGKLLQQVRNCNTNIGLKWFEDEELHVTRYLNDTYYKFEK